MSPVISILHVNFATPEVDLRAAELEKYRQLPSYAREDFLAGRAAVKQALKNYEEANFEISTGEVSVNNLESGQPYIENHASLCCSISHSRGYGMGGVAPYRIGVDIERVRPRKKMLLPFIAEQQELALVSDFFGVDTDETTLMWTIKESVLKGLGVGLSISPSQIAVTRKLDESAFEVHVPGRRSSYWQAWPSRLGNFYLCVAYEKKHQREPRINWPSGDLVSSAQA